MVRRRIFPCLLSFPVGTAAGYAGTASAAVQRSLATSSSLFGLDGYGGGSTRDSFQAGPGGFPAANLGTGGSRDIAGAFSAGRAPSDPFSDGGSHGGGGGGGSGGAKKGGKGGRLPGSHHPPAHPSSLRAHFPLPRRMVQIPLATDPRRGPASASGDKSRMSASGQLYAKSTSFNRNASGRSDATQMSTPGSHPASPSRLATAQSGSLTPPEASGERAFEESGGALAGGNSYAQSPAVPGSAESPSDGAASAVTAVTAAGMAAAAGQDSKRSSSTSAGVASLYSNPSPQLQQHAAATTAAAAARSSMPPGSASASDDDAYGGGSFAPTPNAFKKGREISMSSWATQSPIVHERSGSLRLMQKAAEGLPLEAFGPEAQQLMMLQQQQQQQQQLVFDRLPSNATGGSFSVADAMRLNLVAAAVAAGSARGGSIAALPTIRETQSASAPMTDTEDDRSDDDGYDSDESPEVTARLPAPKHSHRRGGVGAAGGDGGASASAGGRPVEGETAAWV